MNILAVSTPLTKPKLQNTYIISDHSTDYYVQKVLTLSLLNTLEIIELSLHSYTGA